MDKLTKRDDVIDDQKWSSIMAYTAAYNEWKAALDKHKDAFDPEVTKLWDKLLLRQKEYKRMVKK